MTRSRLVWAAGLALLLMVNLVTSAPARLLGWVIPAEQLSVLGLTGTVWRGSASSVMLRLPQGYVQLGAVNWSLKPLSLLLLAPHLTLHSEWGSQILTGELVLRGQRDLDVYNLQAQVAAGVLSHFAPVAVDGMFKLQLPSMQLRDGLPHSITGQLTWQEGAWRSPQGLVPLGSYAMDMQQAAGEQLQGKISTLSGPLQANGTLQLQARHYEVDIQLAGEGAANPQLQQMLSLMAVPEDGGFRLSLKGDF